MPSFYQTEILWNFFWSVFSIHFLNTPRFREKLMKVFRFNFISQSFHENGLLLFCFFFLSFLIHAKTRIICWSQRKKKSLNLIKCNLLIMQKRRRRSVCERIITLTLHFTIEARFCGFVYGSMNISFAFPLMAYTT